MSKVFLSYRYTLSGRTLENIIQLKKAMLVIRRERTEAKKVGLHNMHGLYAVRQNCLTAGETQGDMVLLVLVHLVGKTPKNHYIYGILNRISRRVKAKEL